MTRAMPLDLPLLLEFVLKMTMTATIVVAASVVAERSGPLIGAMIAALPTAAGAAYIILAIEHAPLFIADSAVGSITANAAVAVFSLVYAVLAQRHGVLASLCSAMLIWLACAAMLRTIDWTVPSAVVLNALVFAILVPVGARYRSDIRIKVETRSSDIAWRALAVAVCVIVVTAASHSIGSFASGMFAVFPVVISSLLVIIQLRLGGPAAASVAAHVPVPLIGLSLGFLAVHYLAVPIGVWWSLAVGLVVCLMWSGLLWFANQRRIRPADRP
jgi:hypothetical protein